MPNQDESLFEQALRYEIPTERAAFLDRECGVRSDLRREIESLLAAYSKGDFLESLACASPLTMELPTSGECPGTVIGRYKLLEQIGEGGMGLVYMAEQTEPVRRRVALKVVKPGMDSRQVLARFDAERQALALMDHPNIAKVHDAGATKEGRPYFVMELVRGIPITEYCDQARLSPRARLELFVSVCKAVVHAHQKGVIHRDLKPSNILVSPHDGTPVAKVIDFGIAKAMTQQLTELTVFTGFSQMLGTPLYMSPEQAELNGLDVDTRSDVYSLGVLLYELLTGHTPFDKASLNKVGIDEMRRIIREDEPPRPSQKISTINQKELSTLSHRCGLDERQLGPLLRGELDWIVMKCLEKDRARRYDSASALAQDIERYLRDEPVQACPPTLRYRVGKLLRRHRLGIIAATGVFFALAMGILIANWQARVAWDAKQLADQRWQREQAAYQEAEQQRELAEKHLQLAFESIDKLLSGVAEERLLSEPHMDSLRRRLLADALSFCEKLTREESNDARVQLRRAQAARRVSQINRRLGDFPTALSESQRAIAILESLSSEPTDRAAIDSELSLAQVQFAANLQALLRFEEAEKAYQNQIQLARKLVASSPTDFKAKEHLALSLRSLANLQSNNHKQDFTAAHATREEAIQLLAELRKTHPENRELQSNLAAEYHNLAHDLWEQGKLDEAGMNVRNAIQTQERAVAVSPKAWQREFLGNHYSLLGDILRDQSNLERAAAAYEQCLEIRTKLSKDHPAVPSYQLTMAQTLQELARTWKNRSDLTKAIETAAIAVTHCEDLAARFDHCKVHLANALRTLSNIEREKGRDSKHPAELLERALTIERELLAKSLQVPAYRFNLAGSCSNLAAIYADNYDFDRAEPLYREAMALTGQLIKDFPESREYYLRHTIVTHNLAGMLDDAGRDLESIEIARELFQTAKLLHSKWKEAVEYEATYAEAAVSLAMRLIDANAMQEAKALLEMAEPILKRHVKEHSLFPYEHIRARWGMAKILKPHDPAGAETILEETATALRALLKSKPADVVPRIVLAKARLDLAETLQSNTANLTEDQKSRGQLAVEEAVTLYRQLLSEKGGRFVLLSIRDYENSATLQEYEDFLRLIADAKAATESPQSDVRQ